MFCTQKNIQFIQDHPFSAYAHFSEKRKCAFQGVINVSFSENHRHELKDTPTWSSLLWDHMTRVFKPVKWGEWPSGLRRCN